MESANEQPVLLGTSWADAGETQVLSIGETVDLNYYGITNWYHADYEWSWTSFDNSVVSVNSVGVITAKAEGSTFVTLALKHKPTGKVFSVQPVEVKVTK